MSREKCIRCDEVVVTTNHLNGFDGLFVSYSELEVIESKARHADNLDLHDLMVRNDKTIAVAICEGCQSELRGEGGEGV